jgi:hypothetical protein
MDGSRTERILADWEETARSLPRPASAPRPQGVRARSSLAPMLAAVLLVAVALVAAGILGGISQDVGSDSPAPPASPVVTPSSASPGETTAPADQETAERTAQTYQEALVDRSWAAAWDLLAAEAQVRSGSFDAFVAERSVYEPLRAPYVMVPATRDPATIQLWVAPDYPATADLDRAFIIEIDYQVTQPSGMTGNVPFDVLLVAPDAAGRWRIWPVR